VHPWLFSYIIKAHHHRYDYQYISTPYLPMIDHNEFRAGVSGGKKKCCGAS